MKEYFHAFKIINEKCTGCTACVRVCPTEAIRLRNNKVEVDSNRCIDCGECLTACKYGALVAISDKLDVIKDYEYKIAITDYCFPGQFSDVYPYDKVKEILKGIGFDLVIDEAEATESMSSMIRDFITKNPQKRPILSTSCPAVVRLIQARYPSLLENILTLESTMSVLAQYYRHKISRDKNIDDEKIGIFAIVPCIAMVTSVYQPEGATKPYHQGAISVREAFNEVMKNLYDKDCPIAPEKSLTKGYGWAVPGQEADSVRAEGMKVMAVTGIHNVIEILSKIENQQIEGFDYIVLKSCINGCAGGGFNVENPFVSTSRILRRKREEYSHILDTNYFIELYNQGQYDVIPLEPRPVMQLDDDIKVAISKMKMLNEILAQLPGINCCACGSPTCQALAEDIVNGKASLDDCLVRLKQKKSKNKKEEL
ncbi:MAG: [Fe-Fe] hydrogenase large subunit C-terminal domain-containing protein [Candidatus Cloacimonetes bacterium]|nr:[Fe-Fe] hydrogenase large subunit C-terminal domain-containing protein [Candidatus Cloacimonadota bacterium]